MFHSERARAISAYQRFINEEVGREARSPFVELNPNDQRVLGSDAFAAKMLGDAWRPRSCTTLQQIIAEACKLFEVDEELLHTPSRAAR